MGNVCRNLKGNYPSSRISQVSKSEQKLNITYSDIFSGYDILPWAQGICTGKVDTEPDLSSKWNP